jgi:hypothetical protein
VIVSNGDFYPRNLIVGPDGRIVVVDWETWNPGSPFHTVDHPENVAAFFYVHMWGSRFAKGVVIQALELAGMWLNGTDRHLAAIQASIITTALEEMLGG